MAYLLDTDVLIDLSRERPGAAAFVASLGSEWSIYVRAIELGIGWLAYQLLLRYAKSHGLQEFDALITATAMENGLTLVSKNRKHFVIIEGLNLIVPSY